MSGSGNKAVVWQTLKREVTGEYIVVGELGLMSYVEVCCSLELLGCRDSRPKLGKCSRMGRYPTIDRGHNSPVTAPA